MYSSCRNAGLTKTLITIQHSPHDILFQSASKEPVYRFSDSALANIP